MSTQTETATIENNQYEGDNQNFEQNFSADTGAMDTNLGSAGVGMKVLCQWAKEYLMKPVEVELFKLQAKEV